MVEKDAFVSHRSGYVPVNNEKQEAVLAFEERRNQENIVTMRAGG